MVVNSVKKIFLTLSKNGAAQKLISRYNSHLSYQQALAYVPATQLTTLDNKMRVASEENGRRTTTLGLYLELGSRDEKAEQSGIGGMFEHLALQGTAKRSAADVRERLRDLGAKLEISRGREITSLTTTCANENVADVMEILADIVQHTKLDPVEIEKQKGVMLSKLENTEATNMEGVLMDHLHSVAFQDTPLALSPMGKTESIKSLSAVDLLDYQSNLMVADRMLLAAAGGVTHEKLTELAAKHFTACDGSASYGPTRDYCRFTSCGVRIRDDDMATAHMSFAFQSAPVGSPDFLTLELAKTLLGSWDTTQPGYHSGDKLRNMMTNTNIAHNYKLFNLGYSDTGLFGFYTTCTRMNVQKVIPYIGGHIRDLSGYISDADMIRGKNKLRLQILKALEHNPATVNDIATQMLYTGKRLNPLQLNEALNDITIANVTDAMTRYTLKMPVAQSGVGPIEAMQVFNVNQYNENINMFSLL